MYFAWVAQVFVFATGVINVNSAPVQNATIGRVVREKGCYYLSEHYDNGERIDTYEPCLNCTCMNSVLMCYLRICPFVKPVGEECIVERDEGDCCPKIWCPEVIKEKKTDPSKQNDKNGQQPGCYLDDTYYPDGAQLPHDPKRPCEVCYCIRNSTACVMQECELKVEGCSPIYKEGQCCPCRYNCTYEEATPTPPGVTVSELAEGCYLNDGQIVEDGEAVNSTNPCEHCYCMRNEVVCAIQECQAPSNNCKPVPPKPNQCCPDRYECVVNSITFGGFSETEGQSLNFTTVFTDDFTSSYHPQEFEIKGGGKEGIKGVPKKEVLDEVPRPVYIPTTRIPTTEPPTKDTSEELATSEVPPTSSEPSLSQTVKISGVKGTSKIHGAEDIPTKTSGVKSISSDRVSSTTESPPPSHIDGNIAYTPSEELLHTDIQNSDASSEETPSKYEDISLNSVSVDSSFSSTSKVVGIKGASKIRPTQPTRFETVSIDYEVKVVSQDQDSADGTTTFALPTKDLDFVGATSQGPLKEFSDAIVGTQSPAVSVEEQDSSWSDITSEPPKIIRVKGKKPSTPSTSVPYVKPEDLAESDTVQIDKVRQPVVKPTGIKGSQKQGHHQIKGKRPISQGKPILPVGVIPGEQRSPSKPTSQPTTRRPVVVQPIPGEGICRIGDIVFKHGQEMEPIDACKKNCKCINSKIFCDEFICNDLETTDLSDCSIIHRPDECCPHYECGATLTSPAVSVSITEVSYEDYALVTLMDTEKTRPTIIKITESIDLTEKSVEGTSTLEYSSETSTPESSSIHTSDESVTISSITTTPETIISTSYDAKYATETYESSTVEDSGSFSSKEVPALSSETESSDGTSVSEVGIVTKTTVSSSEIPSETPEATAASEGSRITEASKEFSSISPLETITELSQKQSTFEETTMTKDITTPIRTESSSTEETTITEDISTPIRTESSSTEETTITKDTSTPIRTESSSTEGTSSPVVTEDHDKSHEFSETSTISKEINESADKIPSTYLESTTSSLQEATTTEQSHSPETSEVTSPDVHVTFSTVAPEIVEAVKTQSSETLASSSFETSAFTETTSATEDDVHIKNIHTIEGSSEAPTTSASTSNAEDVSTEKSHTDVAYEVPSSEKPTSLGNTLEGIVTEKIYNTEIFELPSSEEPSILLATSTGKPESTHIPETSESSSTAPSTSLSTKAPEEILATEKVLSAVTLGDSSSVEPILSTRAPESEATEKTHAPEALAVSTSADTSIYTSEESATFFPTTVESSSGTDHFSEKFADSATSTSTEIPSSKETVVSFGIPGSPSEDTDATEISHSFSADISTGESTPEDMISTSKRPETASDETEAIITGAPSEDTDATEASLGFSTGISTGEPTPEDIISTSKSPETASDETKVIITGAPPEDTDATEASHNFSTGISTWKPIPEDIISTSKSPETASDETEASFHFETNIHDDKTKEYGVSSIPGFETDTFTSVSHTTVYEEREKHQEITTKQTFFSTDAAEAETENLENVPISIESITISTTDADHSVSTTDADHSISTTDAEHSISTTDADHSVSVTSDASPKQHETSTYYDEPTGIHHQFHIEPVSTDSVEEPTKEPVSELESGITDKVEGTTGVTSEIHSTEFEISEEGSDGEHPTIAIFDISHELSAAEISDILSDDLSESQVSSQTPEEEPKTPASKIEDKVEPIVEVSEIPSNDSSESHAPSKAPEEELKTPASELADTVERTKEVSDLPLDDSSESHASSEAPEEEPKTPVSEIVDTVEPTVEVSGLPSDEPQVSSQAPEEEPKTPASEIVDTVEPTVEVSGLPSDEPQGSSQAPEEEPKILASEIAVTVEPTVGVSDLQKDDPSESHASSQTPEEEPKTTLISEITDKIEETTMKISEIPSDDSSESHASSQTPEEEPKTTASEIAVTVEPTVGVSDLQTDDPSESHASSQTPEEEPKTTLISEITDKIEETTMKISEIPSDDSSESHASSQTPEEEPKTTASEIAVTVEPTVGVSDLQTDDPSESHASSQTPEEEPKTTLISEITDKIEETTMKISEIPSDDSSESHASSQTPEEEPKTTASEMAVTVEPTVGVSDLQTDDPSESHASSQTPEEQPKTTLTSEITDKIEETTVKIYEIPSDDSSKSHTSSQTPEEEPKTTLSSEIMDETEETTMKISEIPSDDSSESHASSQTPEEPNTASSEITDKIEEITVKFSEIPSDRFEGSTKGPEEEQYKSPAPATSSEETTIGVEAHSEESEGFLRPSTTLPGEDLIGKTTKTNSIYEESTYHFTTSSSTIEEKGSSINPIEEGITNYRTTTRTYTTEMPELFDFTLKETVSSIENTENIQTLESQTHTPSALASTQTTADYESTASQSIESETIAEETSPVETDSTSTTTKASNKSEESFPTTSHGSFTSEELSIATGLQGDVSVSVRGTSFTTESEKSEVTETVTSIPEEGSATAGTSSVPEQKYSVPKEEASTTTQGTLISEDTSGTESSRPVPEESSSGDEVLVESGEQTTTQDTLISEETLGTESSRPVPEESSSGHEVLVESGEQTTTQDTLISEETLGTESSRPVPEESSSGHEVLVESGEQTTTQDTLISEETLGTESSRPVPGESSSGHEAFVTSGEQTTIAEASTSSEVPTKPEEIFVSTENIPLQTEKSTVIEEATTTKEIEFESTRGASATGVPMVTEQVAFDFEGSTLVPSSTLDSGISEHEDKTSEDEIKHVVFESSTGSEEISTEPSSVSYLGDSGSSEAGVHVSVEEEAVSTESDRISTTVEFGSKDETTYTTSEHSRNSEPSLLISTKDSSVEEVSEMSVTDEGKVATNATDASVSIDGIETRVPDFHPISSLHETTFTPPAIQYGTSTTQKPVTIVTDFHFISSTSGTEDVSTPEIPDDSTETPVTINKDDLSIIESLYHTVQTETTTQDVLSEQSTPEITDTTAGRTHLSKLTEESSAETDKTTIDQATSEQAIPESSDESTTQYTKPSVKTTYLSFSSEQPTTQYAETTVSPTHFAVTSEQSATQYVETTASHTHFSVSSEQPTTQFTETTSSHTHFSVSSEQPTAQFAETTASPEYFSVSSEQPTTQFTETTSSHTHFSISSEQPTAQFAETTASPEYFSVSSDQSTTYDVETTVSPTHFSVSSEQPSTEYAEKTVSPTHFSISSEQPVSEDHKTEVSSIPSEQPSAQYTETTVTPTHVSVSSEQPVSHEDETIFSSTHLSILSEQPTIQDGTTTASQTHLSVSTGHPTTQNVETTISPKYVSISSEQPVAEDDETTVSSIHISLPSDHPTKQYAETTVRPTDQSISSEQPTTQYAETIFSSTHISSPSDHPTTHYAETTVRPTDQSTSSEQPTTLYTEKTVSSTHFSVSSDQSVSEDDKTTSSPTYVSFPSEESSSESTETTVRPDDISNVPEDLTLKKDKTTLGTVHTSASADHTITQSDVVTVSPTFVSLSSDIHADESLEITETPADKTHHHTVEEISTTLGTTLQSHETEKTELSTEGIETVTSETSASSGKASSPPRETDLFGDVGTPEYDEIIYSFTELPKPIDKPQSHSKYTTSDASVSSTVSEKDLSPSVEAETAAVTHSTLSSDTSAPAADAVSFSGSESTSAPSKTAGAHVVDASEKDSITHGVTTTDLFTVEIIDSQHEPKPRPGLKPDVSELTHATDSLEESTVAEKLSPSTEVFSDDDDKSTVLAVTTSQSDRVTSTLPPRFSVVALVSGHTSTKEATTENDGSTITETTRAPYYSTEKASTSTVTPQHTEEETSVESSTDIPASTTHKDVDTETTSTATVTPTVVYSEDNRLQTLESKTNLTSEHGTQETKTTQTSFVEGSESDETVTKDTAEPHQETTESPPFPDFSTFHKPKFTTIEGIKFTTIKAPLDGEDTALGSTPGNLRSTETSHEPEHQTTDHSTSDGLNGGATILSTEEETTSLKISTQETTTVIPTSSDPDVENEGKSTETSVTSHHGTNVQDAGTESPFPDFSTLVDKQEPTTIEGFTFTTEKEESDSEFTSSVSASWTTASSSDQKTDLTTDFTEEAPTKLTSHDFTDKEVVTPGKISTTLEINQEEDSIDDDSVSEGHDGFSKLTTEFNSFGLTNTESQTESPKEAVTEQNKIPESDSISITDETEAENVFHTSTFHHQSHSSTLGSEVDTTTQTGTFSTIEEETRPFSSVSSIDESTIFVQQSEEADETFQTKAEDKYLTPTTIAPTTKIPTKPEETDAVEVVTSTKSDLHESKFTTTITPIQSIATTKLSSSLDDERLGEESSKPYTDEEAEDSKDNTQTDYSVASTSIPLTTLEIEHDRSSEIETKDSSEQSTISHIKTTEASYSFDDNKESTEIGSPSTLNIATKESATESATETDGNRQTTTYNIHSKDFSSTEAHISTEDSFIGSSTESEILTNDVTRKPMGDVLADHEITEDSSSLSSSLVSATEVHPSNEIHSDFPLVDEILISAHVPHGGHDHSSTVLPVSASTDGTPEDSATTVQADSLFNENGLEVSKTVSPSVVITEVTTEGPFEDTSIETESVSPDTAALTQDYGFHKQTYPPTTHKEQGQEDTTQLSETEQKATTTDSVNEDTTHSGTKFQTHLTDSIEVSSETTKTSYPSPTPDEGSFTTHVISTKIQKLDEIQPDSTAHLPENDSIAVSRPSLIPQNLIYPSENPSIQDFPTKSSDTNHLNTNEIIEKKPLKSHLTTPSSPDHLSTILTVSDTYVDGITSESIKEQSSSVGETEVFTTQTETHTEAPEITTKPVAGISEAGTTSISLLNDALTQEYGFHKETYASPIHTDILIETTEATKPSEATSHFEDISDDHISSAESPMSQTNTSGDSVDHSNKPNLDTESSIFTFPANAVVFDAHLSEDPSDVLITSTPLEEIETITNKTLDEITENLDSESIHTSTQMTDVSDEAVETSSVTTDDILFSRTSRETGTPESISSTIDYSVDTTTKGFIVGSTLTSNDETETVDSAASEIDSNTSSGKPTETTIEDKPYSGYDEELITTEKSILSGHQTYLTEKSTLITSDITTPPSFGTTKPNVMPILSTLLPEKLESTTGDFELISTTHVDLSKSEQKTTLLVDTESSDDLETSVATEFSSPKHTSTQAPTIFHASDETVDVGINVSTEKSSEANYDPSKLDEIPLSEVDPISFSTSEQDKLSHLPQDKDMAPVKTAEGTSTETSSQNTTEYSHELVSSSIPPTVTSSIQETSSDTATLTSSTSTEQSTSDSSASSLSEEAYSSEITNTGTEFDQKSVTKDVTMISDAPIVVDISSDNEGTTGSNVASEQESTTQTSFISDTETKDMTSSKIIYAPTVEDIVFKLTTAPWEHPGTIVSSSNVSDDTWSTKAPQQEFSGVTQTSTTHQDLLETISSFFPHSSPPSILFESHGHSNTLSPLHPHLTGPTDVSNEDSHHSSQEEGFCLYEGEIYNSAEQIPRKDPCEFCFCFRGDIICLQQSCPPPIRGCYATPIPGFCCPRFHCPVQEMHFNMSRTTTTTTADPRIGKLLVPAAIETTGCEIEGKVYRAHQVVRPASGPCMLCRCESGGIMKCDPRDCQPQAPLLLRLNRDFFKKR